MELASTGWCKRKWLKCNEIIRNLTSGGLGILLALIQLGVTELKKARSCIS